eukprot:6212982-Pleurochrysis_carterae.AAC.6
MWRNVALTFTPETQCCRSNSFNLIHLQSATVSAVAFDRDKARNEHDSSTHLMGYLNRASLQIAP